MPEPALAPLSPPSPAELTASEAARLLRDGSLSASKLVAACFDRIERCDGEIHAWTHLDRAGAGQAAETVDRKRAAGDPLGPLAGIPVGIKDIFNLDGMPCEMGSPIWAGFTPGNDARAVHYLRMADAVFPGKTVTAEFAVHAPGPTENPHRPGCIPGTSSSGSAAAVASYMVPVALGTQTAGSIIRPASYCGVYGFKPSFGAVPRTGMLKTTDTLDTVGWFARTVEDLELLFDTLRVKGQDFPVLEAALQDEERQSRRPGEPWRIGFVRGPKWADAPAETQAAVEAFALKLGALPGFRVEQVACPDELAQAHEVHETIYDRALAYYFKEEFRQHTLVSRQIYDIIDKGNRLTVADYTAALERQNRITERVERLFVADGYDVLLDMATAGEAMAGLDSVDRPDHALIWTLCRLPAVSVPVLRGPSGLPLGVQFVARRYNDRLLFRFLNELREHGVLPARTFPELPPPMIAAAAAASEA